VQKILIVDDDKILLNVLIRKIEMVNPDVEIIIAMSYKEGIKKIKLNENEIHAAIIDLNLPDAKKGEMADYTLSKSIPTVVLTGIFDEEIKKRLFENNILDYIQKNSQKGIDSTINSIQRVLKNYTTNVLLVDDSELQRNILKEMLESIKLNVVTAKDGAEALTIIKNRGDEFSLVLSDYNMPKMDGMELILETRELYDKDHLGIIALSSNKSSEIPTRFIKIGANDYINKPYSYTEVITRVNSVLHIVDLFEEVRKMSYIDYMTGVYNRRYFFNKGQEIFEKSYDLKKPFSLIMIDIDNFKSINDSYGHDVGDIVITSMANIIKSSLGKRSLISRFGGEEFCVIIENKDLEKTKKLLENIRIKTENKIIDTENINLNFTVSMGLYYGIKESLNEMIKLSDRALYQSKRTGKNKITVYEE